MIVIGIKELQLKNLKRIVLIIAKLAQMLIPAFNVNQDSHYLQELQMSIQDAYNVLMKQYLLIIN